ncbi:hypothetical protein XA68_15879 [Ophiocordyceps unilateralis]|uniref:Uncharacterized protein n=1 Tax=Ophiocordyceps unilateralis TaxID=268505 RepID=A0A2A9PP14_OPHUN|nr:hypothetical protein XA68_15879 [Ophiocordyceps unilateralis]
MDDGEGTTSTYLPIESDYLRDSATTLSRQRQPLLFFFLLLPLLRHIFCRSSPRPRILSSPLSLPSPATYPLFCPISASEYDKPVPTNFSLTCPLPPPPPPPPALFRASASGRLMLPAPLPP